jgi:hypothetical protein
MDPAETYIKFIIHVETLVAHGISKMEDRHLRDEGLSKSAFNVIDRLKSPSAKVAIANAFAQLDPEIEEALVGELEFVIANIEVVDDANGDLKYEVSHEFKNNQDADQHDSDLASAAKTGKDSLESILEKWLPKWLKNRLKILNEILSIVFKI